MNVCDPVEVAAQKDIVELRRSNRIAFLGGSIKGPLRKEKRTLRRRLRGSFL
jgi:hypothetical protein